MTIRFLFLIVFLCASAKAIAWDKVLFCDSCATESEFQFFGEGAADQDRAGYEEILVINDFTDTLYNVSVFKERDHGFLMIWSMAAPASAETLLEYQQAMDVFVQAEHVVEIPPGHEGGEAFTTHSREIVGGFIVQQPWYIQATRRINLFNAIRARLGNVPIAVVVFPNGDVAMFRAIPLQSPAVCCEYVEGSARDRNGEFIGPGNSNNEAFVAPHGGGGGPGSNENWGIVITIPGTGTQRVCGRVNGGPIQCMDI